MRLSITEVGGQGVLKSLAAFDRTPKVLEQRLKVIARDMDAFARLRIRKQADSQDKPFAPLAESTLASKARRRKRDQLILIDEGRMIAGIISRVKDLTLEFGDNMKYLHFHQFGAKYLPKRSVFPIWKRSINSDERHLDTQGSGGKFWAGARAVLARPIQEGVK